MNNLSEDLIEEVILSSQALSQIAKKLPILRSLAWAPEIKASFLKDKTLPNPDYSPRDISKPLADLSDLNLPKGDHPVFEWLERIHSKLISTAHMLQARGTADFHTYSVQLFGSSEDVMLDGQSRVIDLAGHMGRIFDGLHIEQLTLGAADQTFSPDEFSKKLEPHLLSFFGTKSPEIFIVKDIASKAIAGSKRIRLREDAIFSMSDVQQLLQHEAFIHAGTALNGRRQDALPILGRAHAGTTETQEGLAVFAEIISGAITPFRFRRLSDRVTAIHMAEQGADFMQVYDYYLEQNKGHEEEAFNNTYRVFRGGGVTGGAPFTKDLVYLKGLMRVHNFLRTAVSLERADLIRLLFIGKLDIEDIPAMAYLRKEGLIMAPKYLPDWAKDLRFLVSYLAYSAFLNQVKLPGFKAYYAKALEDVPNIWDND